MNPDRARIGENSAMDLLIDNDAAKAQGLGYPIPAGWLLQDIRN